MLKPHPRLSGFRRSSAEARRWGVVWGGRRENESGQDKLINAFCCQHIQYEPSLFTQNDIGLIFTCSSRHVRPRWSAIGMRCNARHVCREGVIAKRSMQYLLVVGPSCLPC